MLPVAAMSAMAGGEAQGGGGADPRLKPAAHEFEACLMKEFLQPMQHDALFAGDKDGGSEGSDNGGGDGSDNALLSFGAESLAKAISERGGFGIANKIIGNFEKAKPAEDDTRTGS
jgi:Rod binding domain-containing protein